jgi:exopolysaccharide production protein ExoZ
MIKQVQYLRGIAAMMVVWAHSMVQVSATPTFIRLPDFGPYGVDVFFVISGFIMLVTTWDKPMTPREFIWHRIRRVVPLYWLATLLMVGISMVAPELFKTLKWDVLSLLKSLFFVPYDSLSFPGSTFPLLVPGWTLNYEMFFYALFAISMFLGKPLRLPLLAGTLIVLVADGYVFHPGNVMARVYTDQRLLEFGAGMILGRIWVIRKHMRRDGGSAVLMALGDASYSIYLSHLFTLGALRVLWVRLAPEATMASSVGFMATAMMVCAVAGWLCYRWVERPLTKWISGRSISIATRLETARRSYGG